jgi:hypothetical protein
MNKPLDIKVVTKKADIGLFFTLIVLQVMNKTKKEKNYCHGCAFVISLNGHM